MAEVQRIDPDVALREVTDGRALLVCAYDEPERCRGILLERAMDMQAFRDRLPTLRHDQPIIFYCA